MNRMIVGVIAVVVIIIGVVMLNNNNASAPVNESVSQQPTETPPPSVDPTSTQSKTYEVSMTDTAYVPNTLTIKKGDTVKFINNGTKANWPASSPHPTHTDYSAFDPKKGIAVGESWSFTFNDVGTYRYHDHLNPTRFGSVTVQ